MGEGLGVRVFTIHLDLLYVFDTNVIVSALLFENSKPDQALRYALANGEVLLSVELLEELKKITKFWSWH